MAAKTDPVWHRAVTMRQYDGTVEGPGWYHWRYDADGYVTGDSAGPFPTEEQARAAHAKEKP